MKIKVYGFKFEKKELPKRMTATDAFRYMERMAGGELGKKKNYRYGAYQFKPADLGNVPGWWGGMILKIRDSKAFTKLTEKDGKTILTAETLAEHEKLAELTYFVAHPESGSGMLAHHNHGTSLAGFGSVCRRVFALAQKEALKNAIDETPDEAVALRQEFKGSLEWAQLCNDTDLKSLVKDLKRVSSFELRLATLETKETFLQGIIEKASHETLKLTFPHDCDVQDLAEDAFELSHNDAIEKIKVTGYDQKNVRRDFFKERNPLIFDEFDYDDATTGLSIDLNDWGSSIKSAAMIKKLIAVASVPSRLQLLKLA